MRTYGRKILPAALATLILSCLPTDLTLAQSSPIQPPVNLNSQPANPVTQASASRVSAKPIALSGYCCVSVLDSKKWVKGSEDFAVVLDGMTYLFPGEEERQLFLKNTTRYTPALGGDSVVGFVDRGVRSAGTLHFTANHNGRLFLFQDANDKARFMANPTKYQDADLAYAGNCSVCRVDEQLDMSGNGQFGTVYGGRRYYFPSVGHRKMFLANPSKYAVK